jgi:hypothetical protein
MDWQLGGLVNHKKNFVFKKNLVIKRNLRFRPSFRENEHFISRNELITGLRTPRRKVRPLIASNRHSARSNSSLELFPRSTLVTLFEKMIESYAILIGSNGMGDEVLVAIKAMADIHDLN